MTRLECPPGPGGASSRGLLVRDHERLERLFVALQDGLEADDREGAARLWGELDTGLCAHLDFEEREILPAFHDIDPVEAEKLLREHQQIRRGVAELGVGVDLHLLRAEVASEFIALLRRHAQREDALMYRWAEQELPALSPPVSPGAHGPRPEPPGAVSGG
jgi:Hemerythrin HHE cation binding domain